jgi:hypothetical protein
MLMREASDDADAVPPTHRNGQGETADGGYLGEGWAREMKGERRPVEAREVRERLAERPKRVSHHVTHMAKGMKRWRDMRNALDARGGRAVH